MSVEMIMTQGRNICNQLKAVRRSIAEENGIPLEVEECTYKGECRGTCPRCEAEVRYLEGALTERIRRGKVATVAGLALGLAATPTLAQAQTPVDTITNPPNKNIEQMGCLKGEVVDAKTKVAIPFASVVAFKDGEQYAATVTDSLGMYNISLPQGIYGIRVMDYGHKPYERSEIRVKSTGFTVLSVDMIDIMDTSDTSRQIPIIQCGGIVSGRKLTKEDIDNLPSTSPYYQYNDPNPAYPPHEQMIIEGVRVIVR